MGVCGTGIFSWFFACSAAQAHCCATSAVSAISVKDTSTVQEMEEEKLEEKR